MDNVQYIVLENSTLDMWAFIVSVLSVLITTILTIYTIRQNTKLNRTQQDLQLYIQNRQETDNAMALKLANRQYAEKVYEVAFEIFSFSELIGGIIPILKTKSYNKCCDIIEGAIKVYPDIEKHAKYLIVGEHYLTNDLNATISDLRSAFDDLMEATMIFRLPKDIYTEEEISKEYPNSLDNIAYNVDRINKAKNVIVAKKDSQFSLHS